MYDRLRQIEFLRAFRELSEQYPDIQISLDSEYTDNGLMYKTNGEYKDFDELLIDQYYYRKCKVCNCDVGECQQFCETCAKGCEICKGETVAICGYCRTTRLCKNHHIRHREETIMDCMMTHLALSFECYKKFKEQFANYPKTDLSYHDKIINDYRKLHNVKSS